MTSGTVFAEDRCAQRSGASNHTGAGNHPAPPVPTAPPDQARQPKRQFALRPADACRRPLLDSVFQPRLLAALKQVRHIISMLFFDSKDFFKQTARRHVLLAK